MLLNILHIKVYLLCSKSGFSDKLREVVYAEGVILWDAEMLKRALTSDLT
jgi:hypothetical protein